MFPVSDFDFFVCGIATVAASVGYACSRRMSFTHQDEAGVGGAGSVVKDDASSRRDAVSNFKRVTKPEDPSSSTLKRKRMADFDDDDWVDLGYPENLRAIYPNKRQRTPPPESDSDDDKTLVNSFTDESPPASEDSSVPESSVSEEGSLPNDQPAEAQPVPHTPVTQDELPEENSGGSSEIDVASSAAVDNEPSPESKKVDLVTTTTKQEEPDDSLLAASISRRKRPFASYSSGGFASFATSSSGFVSAPSSSRPVWSTPSGSTVFQTQDSSFTFGLPGGSSSSQAGPSQPAQSQHLTGEEDESVDAELKGVKLFVKRGSKEFSDGIFGNVKLLSRPEQSKRRILFRREPLWKVTMNVRLGEGGVRCSFDEGESILRIVALEEEDDQKEVVIYAIKPGRSCSKLAFKTFAEEAVRSPVLKADV